MNLLEEKGYLSKMICGSNFSYILEEDIFSLTEYKVLQSQNSSSFVKCMKMLYNGKEQLYYLTKDYKSLLSLVSGLDVNNFMTIIGNLFSDIVDVKNNGFLSCQKIDLSFDHLYVDPTTYKVSLVYLPLNKAAYNGETEFENELRTGLIKLIAECSFSTTVKAMKLKEDLADGMLSLEDLCGRVKAMCGSGPVPGNRERSLGGEGVLFCLKSINAPTEVVLEMKKERLVIGKNAALVDAVISYNRAISRVHCRIDKVGNEYTITDLESANGTYVNGVKVQPKKSQKICAGDIIRLADSDFQVIM